MDINQIPLDQIDVSQPELFQNDTIGRYFERLRAEAPVHYCPRSRFGPYWSITRYADILAVDSNHQDFSSAALNGGIQIVDFPKGKERKNFINMDPPEHDEHRKVVTPVVSPSNLAGMESLIRAHVTEILDGLPRDEPFNWVELVAVELTTRMLATLFDFPFEDRRLLTWWSDVASVDLKSGTEIDTEEKRLAELAGCLKYFKNLLAERAEMPPKTDLVSMLAHSSIEMTDQELLSTLILLIIGGNDTTRNSISGGLLALHEHPVEMAKLRRNPKLIKSLVPEIVRWQTPLTNMRRTTVREVEVGGVTIPAGEKVIMWYLSGNRDSTAIPDADEFRIDRDKPRQHLSFGFGVHRCVGNRLAEMQLRVLWEEILSREIIIDVVGPAERIYSNAVRGITKLPVKLA